VLKTVSRKEICLFKLSGCGGIRRVSLHCLQRKRLCEAVDFENQIFNLKQKDKMKNKNSNLTQNPPFCKTDVSGMCL
jgi:hypothetical protein